jgi:hypothetical protein
MADALTATDAPTIDPGETAGGTAGTRSPIGEVLRDIARGGIAGILVGIFVAGVGGRIFMRLATILHEDTVGRFTEQQAVIGAITFEGTLALLLFGGLGMGLVAGMIWVIVRPWIGGRSLTRALVTGLLAVALGTPLLVQRTNPDFSVLSFDPMIVGMALALVFAVGFSIVFVDAWLDRHLPRAVGGIGIATTAYLIVTLMGLLLIVPVVAIVLVQPEYQAPVRAGWSLLVVGLCTLAWWVMRVRGGSEPPRWLTFAGRAAIVVAAVLGVVTSLPHLRAATGIFG